MAKRDVIDVLIAEAIGEGDEGLAAVAWTILNRAAETGRTPAQVIADPGDYTGATNPGSATKKAMKDPKVRARVERVWNQVQSGSIPDPTGGATHYWAPKGMKGGKAPYWADEEESAAGRLKIGNHVFLPKQKPNSALSAINAVAPTPMPSRPVALGYARNTGTPAPSVPSAPPGMRALSDSNAAFGVLPFSKTFNPGIYPLEGQGINLWARDRSGNADALIAAANAPRATVPRVPSPQISAARTPARGVGTSYLAPATKVQTYKVDSLGNPIMPGTKSALQLATEAKAARIASGAEKFTPTVPVAQPPRLPSGWVPAVTQGTQAAGSVQLPAGVRPKAVDDAFRQIAAAKTAPVAPVPRAKPFFPVNSQNNLYAAAPAPVAPPLPSDPRLPKGDPALENFKRGQDIASALYPKPATPAAVAAINSATLPRLPMMPPTAMSAARLPAVPVPTVPVRTAPIPAARIPLTQTRTVNPMTQIVPAVQARAGQGLFGGLLNMLTAGNVPQANTIPRGAPTPRPAWQNNPNVQRDDKWAGVLDNFGMII